MIPGTREQKDNFYAFVYLFVKFLRETVEFFSKILTLSKIEAEQIAQEKYN